MRLILFGIWFLMGATLTACNGQKNHTSAVPVQSVQGNVINVPKDFSDIQTAVHNAKEWDTIDVEPGTYAAFVVAQQHLTIRGVNGVPVIAAAITNGTMVMSGTTLEHLRFIGDGQEKYGITIYGSHDVTIRDCDIRTRGGVKIEQAARVLVERCTLYPRFHASFAGTFPWLNGVDVDPSQNVTLRRNTIVGYDENVWVRGSTDTVMEGNIIVQGNVGIHVDNVTLASARIEYNDVWGHIGRYPYGGLDLINPISDPRNSFTPGMGHISANPFFVLSPDRRVDDDGDFRILSSSPCATAGRFHGSIGARDVVTPTTACILTPNLSSPQGPQQFGSMTEVLRFDVTANTQGDVLLPIGGVMTFQFVSSYGSTTTHIRVLNTFTNKIVAEENGSFPMHGGKFPAYASLRVVNADTIIAGTTGRYAVFVETTTLQADTAAAQPALTYTELRAELKRIDWSDGTTARLNDGGTQNVVGNTLTFQ